MNNLLIFSYLPCQLLENPIILESLNKLVNENATIHDMVPLEEECINCNHHGQKKNAFLQYFFPTCSFTHGNL